MEGLPPVASTVVEDTVPDVTVAPDRLGKAVHLLPGPVDPDDRPFAVIVQPQQRVAREDDPVRFGDLARAFTPPHDRPKVLTAGIVGPHFGGLEIQHIDSAVGGGLYAPDVCEGEVGVVAFKAPELKVHLGFGDLGADGLDPGKVGVADEGRTVR